MVSGAEAALVIWLVAAIVMILHVPEAGKAVRRSAVLSGLDSVLPSTDRLSADLQRGARSVVPADLLALVPSGTDAATPSGSTALDAASRQEGRSVLKILASGCGNTVSEGTSFVAGNRESARLLVTNAHVVRGSSHVAAVDSNGRHSATVLAYDAGSDIAVLGVGGLADPVLPLAASPARNGADAKILGYPKDGPLTATPAVILQRLPTVHRAGGGLSVREVYRIRADVEHGNSGSPLITTGGQVVGVVNALSQFEHDTGYALTLSPVRNALIHAAKTTSPSGTGSCA